MMPKATAKDQIRKPSRQLSADSDGGMSFNSGGPPATQTSMKRPRADRRALPPRSGRNQPLYVKALAERVDEALKKTFQRLGAPTFPSRSVQFGERHQDRQR